MAYFFFILTTLTLFIRPSELNPDLATVPIYYICIIGALITGFPGVLAQLQWDSLRRNPITIGVVGMLLAVVLSHLSHFDTWYAREHGTEFLKVVLYYLLLVSSLNSTRRIRSFLYVLLICIIGLAVFAILHYHGLLEFRSLAAVVDFEFDPVTGEYAEVKRLQATGIFSDPNDLSLILVAGITLCLYAMGDPLGLPRVVWLGPLTLFVYTLALTHSRGGFLALVSAIILLCISRFGWRKSLPPLAVALPLMLVLFAGRQTDIGGALEGDTGQGRIQLWALSLVEFQQYPLFGIGVEKLPDAIGLTSHNTFVQCWAEVGLFGGTIFCGIVMHGLHSLHKVGKPQVIVLDQELLRLRPYLIAVLTAYAIGMLSLSRAYIVPTYLFPGVATACLALIQTSQPISIEPFDLHMVRRWASVSIGFLFCTYVFTKILVRWL